MSAVRPDFYLQLRARYEARLMLREPSGAHPPERLLQAVWHHQRLRRDQLLTTDGRPLRVLHPGFWNHQAGPDFHGAVVQIAGEDARSGDVEIDLTEQNWKGHQHAGNPAFANVILHVVWSAGPGERSRPTLALEMFLDAPLAELQTWAGTAAAVAWPDSLRGACSAPLGQLSPETTDTLLRQAATVRFQRKAIEMEARARQAGWEQSLREGLFRALGYKQNVWPMQRIAELAPLLMDDTPSLPVMQARLFGVSSFLNASHERTRGHDYLQTMWGHWWRDRERFHEVVLPKTLWRLNGLRPANQPQRRLALAAHWLTSKDLVAKLETWFADATSSTPHAQSLQACLQPAQDAYWSRHWSFHSPRLPKDQPLLGESRATDLAINVVLPWFWVRARAGGNKSLTALAERRFLEWPAAQDNSVLRLARQRLLGRQTEARLDSAAAQQGLMQIVRDFCDHSNAVCADCPFPGVVRQLIEEEPTGAAA